MLLFQPARRSTSPSTRMLSQRTPPTSRRSISSSRLFIAFFVSILISGITAGVLNYTVAKGGLRTSTKTLPWARLPPLLAEAGWCLINYPANTQMPGEVPPGVDTQKYIHEGIRAIKRPALAEFAKELVHPQSPSWKLIKGDRKCGYFRFYTRHWLTEIPHF